MKKKGDVAYKYPNEDYKPPPAEVAPVAEEGYVYACMSCGHLPPSCECKPATSLMTGDVQQKGG